MNHKDSYHMSSDNMSLEDIYFMQNKIAHDFFINNFSSWRTTIIKMIKLRYNLRNYWDEYLLIEISPEANILSWTLIKMLLVVPEGHDNVYDIE